MKLKNGISKIKLSGLARLFLNTEDPAALTGGLEMIQTWVALPEKDEEADPSFVNYTPEQLPVFTDKGIWMRLIAGNAYGLTNNVKTNSPLFYLHVILEADASFGLVWCGEADGAGVINVFAIFIVIGANVRGLLVLVVIKRNQVYIKTHVVHC